MTGSRFAASKELPVKTPSDAIAQLLDKMSASVGGDMETVIEVCLDASWRVVDRTDTIPHAAVKWFKTMNEDIAAEVSAKFSDGIANAKGIDAPEQITKLDFYDPHYEVPVGMDEIYSYLQSWKTPLGASIWESTAVGDLQATGSVIAEHHHSEQPEDIVLPLYIYSASQIGSRVIWCANMDDRNWELLDGERFEEAFKSGDTFELKRSMFPDLSGNLIRSDCAMVKVPSHPSDDVQAFQTLTSSDEHVTIVRYEHSKRGDSLLGPYSDTVSWLPFPSIEHQFQVPLTSMPSSGILEYLYSRGAEETVSWHPEWSSRFALGQAIEMLIKVLFAVTDQQTFDLKMYRHFTILIESLLGTPEERRKREDDMKQVLVEMVSEGASDSSSLGHAASVSAIRLFIGSGQFISELAFPPAVVKKLINAKLGSNPEPSPALLAHSLEIQELRWCGKKYLLSLSGERKYLITENGELAEVFRTNNPFPDQVFWLLNAAMRHKQFQTPTKLEVYSARHRGDYVYCPNTKEWTMNGVAAVHKEGEWSVNGDILEKNQYWLQMGSFMVPQVTPLIYWLDRALRAIDEKCEKPQTYRGLKNVTLPKEVYDKDKVVLWSAYSSSTSDRGVASSFAKDDGQAAIFALHGNTCVCISPWSRFSRERELLFPPNSTFLISASLDETQQEILGVANLQLFSMKEVDRYGAMVVYLRKVVNHVISTVQAAMVPVHVRQLFKIMRCFEKHDLDGALEHTCDPDEPVLGTPEGVALARMLIDIGADPGVRTKVAMRSQDASVESLSQLVMAGGSWADAFEWVLMYEKQNREAIDSLCTFLGDSILKHEGLLVSEQSEFEMLLSGVWDRVATSDSEHFVPQVTVTGLKGKASYLNGLYARLDANSAAKMGLHPEKTFAKVATRVNSWAHISYNEHHDCWFLDDAYMKECRQTRGEASEAVAFMWPPPFRARPVNMCLLGKWMDGFCVIFSKPAVPKDKQVAWTDQDLASFEGLDEDVDSGTVERFKANGPQQCSEDSRVKLNRHSAKPWWNGGTNFKIQTTIHEQDLVELRLGNSVRRLVSHSYGRGFAMGIAHDKRKTYARTPGRVEQSVNLSRGELPFNKHLAEGWEAFQLLLTDEKHREITEKIKKRVSLLEGRVPPNDCCSNIKTSFSTPAKYERRARLRTDETTCPSALEIVDGIGCGLYKMKSELCYETEAGFKFFKKDEESKWLLKVPESVVDYQMLLNATVEAVNDNELKTYLEETEAQKTEAIKALRSWDGDLCCSFSSQRTGLLSRNIVELLDICRLDNKEDTDAEDYSDVVRMFQDDAEATIKKLLPLSRVIEAKAHILKHQKQNMPGIDDKSLDWIEALRVVMNIARTTSDKNGEAAEHEHVRECDIIPADGILVRSTRQVGAANPTCAIVEGWTGSDWASVAPPVSKVPNLLRVTGEAAVEGSYTSFYGEAWVDHATGNVMDLRHDYYVFCDKHGSELLRSNVQKYGRAAEDIKSWAVKKGEEWEEVMHVAVEKPVRVVSMHGTLAARGGDIITIGVGQAGVQICESLLSLYSIEPSGVSAYHNCLFNVTESAALSRALLIDTDDMVLNTLKRKRYNFLSDENFYSLNSRDSVTWERGRGLYREEVLEAVQKHLEAADRIAAIHFVHAVSGGTGPALTERIIQEMGCKKITKKAFPIFPSPVNASLDTQVAPYHACLYYAGMSTLCDLIVPFDNESMRRVLISRTDARRPLFGDYNEIVANVVSACSDSMRHDGPISVNPTGITQGLVPYPQLRYAWAGLAPMVEHRANKLSLNSLALSALSAPLTGADYMKSTMSVGLFMRGPNIEASKAHITSYNLNYVRKGRQYLPVADWSPCSRFLSVCHAQPPKPLHSFTLRDRTVTTLTSGLGITVPMQQIKRSFNLLMNQRSYLHWMIKDGMEEDTLKQAGDSTTSLIKEYKNACAEPDYF